MTVVVNPAGFTIDDSVAQAQGVTSVQITVGTTSGGPYTTATWTLTAAQVAAGLAGGVFSGTLASIGDTLGAGTYYAVATVTNAAGTSGPSPQVEFQVVTVPTAPSAFSLA
jgi:hypothetical protein